MDDAEMRTSTLPPQCGHFFRCGPATFSIFSVKRPHFRHLYSYRGTDILLVGLRISKYNTRVTMALGVAQRVRLALCVRSESETILPWQRRQFLLNPADAFTS